MLELKVGIIGMGKMGLLHASILNSLEGVKVISIADKEKVIFSITKKMLPQIKIFNDVQDMIKSCSLDLVYITTPVQSHIPLAKICIENKIPFFIEKPLSKDYEESKIITESIQEKSIPNMVGYYLRFFDTFSKAKEIIENNEIGNITSINASIYQTLDLSKTKGWRFNKEVSGGGILIDLGSHLIDLLIWYFGKPKNVQVQKMSLISEGIEDEITADIMFENNLKCDFIASWKKYGYRLQETTIELKGENGTLKINEDYLQIQIKDQDVKTFYKQDLYEGVPIDIGGPEYTKEDQYFIKCIQNNIIPKTDVIAGSYVQLIIDKLYQSYKTKQKMELKYSE